MKTLKEKLQAWAGGAAPPNVILLTSVENQEAADERIPHLLRIPAAVRGLSLEPLLGSVDLSKWIGVSDGEQNSSRRTPQISWAIIGGESGPRARPCNVEWIRSLVRQCKAAGVACFVKQLGSFSIEEKGSQRSRILWDDRKGGDPAEWPADIQVREWPR